VSAILDCGVALLDTEQIAHSDRLTVASGISAMTLMDSAGRAVALAVL